jgi:hypothetical protein
MFLLISQMASAATRIPYLPTGWQMVSADVETKTRTFQSPDGRAKLITHPSRASRDLRADMDEIAYREGERITYQRRGRTWLAVSGYKGDRIFYRKSNIACRPSGRANPPRGSCSRAQRGTAITWRSEV